MKIQLTRISLSAVFVAMATYTIAAVGAAGAVGCGDCELTCEVPDDCPLWYVTCGDGVAGPANGCSYLGCCWVGEKLCAEVCGDRGADVVLCRAVDDP